MRKNEHICRQTWIWANTPEIRARTHTHTLDIRLSMDRSTRPSAAGVVTWARRNVKKKKSRKIGQGGRSNQTNFVVFAVRLLD